MKCGLVYVFADERLFTLALLRTRKNDFLHVPVATKKRDTAPSSIRTRPTFSESVMVSAALSKLGFTNLIFVEPGAKINTQHYRDVFLMHELLPAISSRGGSRI